MKSLALLVMLAGCLEPEPARSFEIRLTYDGDRFEANVDFPPYSHSKDKPVVVDGTLTAPAESPILGVTLLAGERVSYDLSVERKPDDTGSTGTGIECVIDEDEVGHTVACTGSRHACSVVLAERQP